MARKPDYADGNQQPLFIPNSTWQRPAELPDLTQYKEIGLDTETRDIGLNGGRGPGWVYRAGHVAGISVAYGPVGMESGLYFPIAHPDTDNFDHDAVSRWLGDHRHLRWVFQNAPYDLGWFRSEFGLTPPTKIDDTTAMSVMLDEHHMEYNLNAIAARCGVPQKDEGLLREAASVYGMNPKSDLWRLPAKFVGAYAEGDALTTLRAARVMRPQLIEDGVTDAYELEMQLIPLIQEMRWRGIRVDLDRADMAIKHCMEVRDEAFKELGQQLNERVGMDEIGRTAWLHRVFDQEGISYPRTPPTGRFPDGQPSFTAGSTGWMHKHPHWLPRLIVRADKYNNAATKFIKGFIIDYAHKGRIHASINQFMSEDDTGGKKGAKTFRFSYSDPALQQMPSRDSELKPLIRGCFVPEPGELWGRIDYEQQEYRLIVHFAALMKLNKADDAVQKYRDNPDTDFHQMVADMTGLDRKPAKDANFAKAFGAAVPKFASMIDKSQEEAARIMEQYDKEMPFVAELNDKCKTLAGKRGWVRLLDGARMHFPFWEGPWIEWEEKKRYFDAGFKLHPGRWDEIGERISNEIKPVWVRGEYVDMPHPWKGKRLRRADTRKAMNALIQGSAARMTKIAMRNCWREGLVPLLQVHDELNFSCAVKETGDHAARLMAEAVTLEIPLGADVEWGIHWGRAAKEKKGYGATWKEALAELKR